MTLLSHPVSCASRASLWTPLIPGLLVSLCMLIPTAPVAAELSTEQRTQAVANIANDAVQCKALKDFYWEIGDAKQTLASGTIGTHFQSTRVIGIASASKWIFGSYVLEKIGKDKDLSEAQRQALEMLSGYTSLHFGSCLFSRTVASCFNHGDNNSLTPEHVGKFFYNGAHDQKLAIDLGLGALDADEFGQEIRHYLGSELDFNFRSPQPAGGMEASPASYAKFLRKILAGELRMNAYLGASPVCTLPQSCPDAVQSPAASAWHYSINHWIEDDPQSDDGAFSSPGAFGFYPWISADKQWYGLVARVSYKPNAYKESVYCGQLLRRTWVDGN